MLIKFQDFKCSSAWFIQLDIKWLSHLSVDASLRFTVWPSVFLESDASVVFSSVIEAVDIIVSSITCISSTQKTLFPSKADTPQTLWQCLLSWPSTAPRFLKAHSRGLRVHSGLFSCSPLPAKIRYRRSLGWQCKTIHLQYLCSESQLYITFNTRLLRFIVWPWFVQTANPGPEWYQGSGLKHVSSDMCIGLASGGLDCEETMQL